jgi:nucleoside-diphosphate-sugar epimerase
MRILVTGGTGFLGKRLTLALLAAGHQVRVLGRNEAGCRTLAAEGASIIRADIRDRETVASACAGMEVVYHVAALSAPWGKTSDFHAINAEGTRLIAEACLREKVNRLVYVSSPSVVFDGRDQVNVTESVPYPRRFLSVYSLTKKLGEDHVNAASRRGLPAVIIRPKAIFGPGDTTLLPRLLDRACKGRLPRIGDGSNLVDLTYVDCVVDALLLCLTAPAALGRTYTITNGEPVNLWELIARLLDRCGIRTRLRPLPYRLAYMLGATMEFGACLFGGEPPLTRYLVAILGRTQTYDISAARRDLGYRPGISVHKGIERTLADLV